VHRGAAWPRAWQALVLLLVLPAAACERQSSDPVVRALDAVEAAAEERDAQAVLKMLAPDFKGPGNLNRTAVASQLRRYFLAYEGLDVERADLEVEHGDAAARARFRVVFSGRPRQIGSLADVLPSSAVYRFDVGLRPDSEQDVWLISDATWEHLEPTQP